jgi:predicted secreted protein
MAKPITSRASQLLLKLGDGASPETFAAPCGLTTKGITFTKEMNDTPVPDCDNPDAPAWTERAVTTLSASVSGAGILSMGDLDTWIAFNESTISRNAQVIIVVDAPNSAMGGMWTGKFLMSSFEVTGELGNKIQTNIEMQSDGPVTWTPAP